MPKLLTKTIDQIDHALEASQDTSIRKYLGASSIGRECSRELWYGFRWYKRICFPGRILRLFDRGHTAEPRYIEILRASGLTIWSHKENGDQIDVHACFDHFSGHADGFGCGLTEHIDPATFFVIEIKTHKKSLFASLKKKGVRKAFWEHYVQANIYGYLRGVQHIVYCAVEKDTDDLYMELETVSEPIAKKSLARAEYIIFSEEPPPRISASATWYKCKFCNYAGTCHGSDLPEKNCRSCKHSMPVKDRGRWACFKHQVELTDDPNCDQKDFNTCADYKSHGNA